MKMATDMETKKATNNATNNATRNASKRPLIWLMLACIAPFAASSALYYWWTPPGGQVNYGALLKPQAMPLSQIVVLRFPFGEPQPALSQHDNFHHQPICRYYLSKP